MRGVTAAAEVDDNNNDDDDGAVFDLEDEIIIGVAVQRDGDESSSTATTGCTR